MASKYVIHAFEPPDASYLTLYLDDKVFRLPPNETVEIDRDSNGRALDTPEFYHFELIRQYGTLYGLVEVPAHKTRTGIVLDVDEAMEMAQAKLLMKRHRWINEWAADQLKTRVNKNLPVMAPSGFVAESIKMLNVDLQAQYNFKPVGWDFRPDPKKTSADSRLLAIPVSNTANDDVSEAMAVMRAENIAMKEQLDRVLSMVEGLKSNKAQKEK